VIPYKEEIILDYLIKNGKVLDGTNKSAFKADIGVKNNKIVFVGRAQKSFSAANIISAENFLVTPGFIDTHGHSDLWLFEDPYSKSRIYQGVTTEIMGNCGFSAAPLTDKKEMVNYSSYLLGNTDIDWGWKSLSEYYKKLEDINPSTNVASLVGYNTVRASVSGFDSSMPNEKEMQKIKFLIKESLNSGAIGVSLGLGYPPACWSREEELIQIAEIVEKQGGILAVHKKNSGNKLLTSTEEAINVARETDVHLHISHIKVTGKRNWGKMKSFLKLVEQASSDGVRISMDLYPYSYGSGYLHAFLPKEIFKGGMKKALERLKLNKWRNMVKENLVYDLSWEDIVIISAGDNENDLSGKSIEEISCSKGISPLETIIELILKFDGNVLMNSIGTVSLEDIKKGISHKSCMIGSDGLPPVNEKCVHPRLYGTFTRVISKFVEEMSLLPLREAIYKMTGLPAKTFDINNRGTIRVGNYADLLVIKPEEIKEADSYTKIEKNKLAAGIYHVFINGEHFSKFKDKTGIRKGSVICKNNE